MRNIILLLFIIAFISCTNKKPEIYGKWEKVRFQEYYEGKYYDIEDNPGGRVAVVFTDSNTINVVDMNTNEVNNFNFKWKVINDKLFRGEDTCIIVKLSNDTLILKEENLSILTYCRVK